LSVQFPAVLFIDKMQENLNNCRQDAENKILQLAPGRAGFFCGFPAFFLFNHILLTTIFDALN
jgi:hypothetical protein